MKSHKEMLMLNQIKQELNEMNVSFVEFENGHLKIVHANYWVASDEWYDPVENKKGLSLITLLYHLNSHNYL